MKHIEQPVPGTGTCQYSSHSTETTPSKPSTESEALSEELRCYATLLDSMTEGVVMVGKDRRLFLVNRRLSEIIGFPLNEVRGLDIGEAIARVVQSGVLGSLDADRLRRQVLGNAAKAATVTFRIANGRRITARYQPLADGGWTGTFQDVTETHRTLKQFAHMATHDALTGLANRKLFMDRVNASLSRLSCRQACAALLCLDLDNFKSVNDTLGHPAGDTLLRATAERLRGAVGPRATIARLGGDEFAIFKPGCFPGEAARLAMRITSALAEPFACDGQDLFTGASIGIACAPTDAELPEELIKCADLALYRAKREGRNRFAFFERSMLREQAQPAVTLVRTSHG